MGDVRLKILPPWSIVIRKFQALFDGDPQIACNTDFSGNHPTIVLACNDGDKVTALQQILPEEIVFGGVTLKVIVDGIPSNRTFKNKKELFQIICENDIGLKMSNVVKAFMIYCVTYSPKLPYSFDKN